MSYADFCCSSSLQQDNADMNKPYLDMEVRLKFSSHNQPAHVGMAGTPLPSTQTRCSCVPPPSKIA